MITTWLVVNYGEELEAVRAVGHRHVLVSWLKWGRFRREQLRGLEVFVDCAAYGQLAGTRSVSSDGFLRAYTQFALEHFGDYFLIAAPDVPMKVDETVERTERFVECLESQHGSRARRKVVAVVQGVSADDYVRCYELLRERGLVTPTIAVGAIAVRSVEGARKILASVRRVAKERVHAFGVDLVMLRRVAALIDSFDTHSWARGVTNHGCVPVRLPTGGIDPVPARKLGLDLSRKEDRIRALTIAARVYLERIRELARRGSNRRIDEFLR